ncbi:hypothetical protein BpHYR1_009090 [Brachionus plicatilis]|uniref:Uncharacterized protein n=1 Tax=Brachionus plicatilis TaxID=10195 RepID=A0A3M7QMU9_BRAPC|nr:hypothetical protein BpHYR1_009090 [Brachionus plicatilis]
MSSIGSLSIDTKEKFLSTLKRINSSNENSSSSAISSLGPSCATSNFSFSEKKLAEKSTNTDFFHYEASKTEVFNYSSTYHDKIPYELNTSNSDDQVSLFHGEQQSRYNLCDEHKKYENLLHLLEKAFKKKKRSKRKNFFNFLHRLSCINLE